MCWEQTRSVIMDNLTGDSTNGIKMLENVENCNSAGKFMCSNLSNDESSGVPSLQGVKVPDENLTPQQRQHREEQLAKLKKMNQFLFPENGGNDFHLQGPENNSVMAGKIQVPPDALGDSGGTPGSSVAIQGPNIANKINGTDAMRNISNIMNHSKTSSVSNSQLDSIPTLSEDVVTSNMMTNSSCAPNEISAKPTVLKQGCMSNMNNTGSLGISGRVLINTGSTNLNMINNSSQIRNPTGGVINDADNTMIENTSDVVSPFNTHQCTSSGQEGGSGGSVIGSHKNINAFLPHQTDMNSGDSMPQMEWSKLHHHMYEEHLKNNHSGVNGMLSEMGSGGGFSGCQQTLTRSNSIGIGGSGGGISHRTNANTSANNRSNQGPPPPYHYTQRSASVPIATQSPNPSSPIIPTSNISLPSPRASNAVGGALSSTTSPSVDVTLSSSSASIANINSTTNTTAAGVSSGGNSSGSINKNTFPQQSSPTPNSNRGRSSVNNINSSPTTSLSHVSPKDIDSKNINAAPASDHKSPRLSSQRSRSPLMNDISNNTMEPRFPSPGLNFTTSSLSGANSQNLSNSFKNQNASLERQNVQQHQFCRRTDNMPLNPNSNRGNQTKMSNTFDPISSLTQMSQQLTGGGVGLNTGGVGSSPNNISGLMGGPGGITDLNINGLMGGPMMSGLIDPGMDHCNQNPSGGGNMGMSGLGASGGQGPVQEPFGSGNCSMVGGNPGPICQRLLNPKMCGPNMSGGFNLNQVGGLAIRDGSSGFPGMMSHRMMNHRMLTNFGNFNVSPNIQVKASTPNTIQYMPVRPQNNNNNNIRAPPSLEFLQRYANPQMVTNSASGPSSSQGVFPPDISALNGPSDLNKMPNTSNMGTVHTNLMNQMNFFGNCNQISGMSMGQPEVGGISEQDGLQGGGIMQNHESMNIPGSHAPMLRGMRPVRQGGVQPCVSVNSGSRMQHPSMANIPPTNGMGTNSFSNNDNESLDCNDPTNGNIFSNPASSGLYQQQKSSKPPPTGISHGPPNLNPNSNSNASLPNNNVINDQTPSSNIIQNSVMMGPNSAMLNSNMPSNSTVPGGSMPGPVNLGYKSFVGPTSNDLKYAQQYHSFQQQLYATSTRNQQPSGGQQQPPNSMSPNNNTNAGFFVNK